MSPVPLPPPEFDFKPKRPPEYHYVSPNQMQKICHLGEGIVACATFRGRRCIVYLPRKGDYPPAIAALIKRHEDGHCNGWPANHPNAR